MSVTKLMLEKTDLATTAGGRFAAALLSFVEVVLFFAVLSPLFGLALAALYFLVTDMPDGGLAAWPGALSMGAWIVLSLAYLLLITLYWVPPKDDGANRVQVGGLVVFLVAALLVGAIWQWALLAGLLQTFGALLRG